MSNRRLESLIVRHSWIPLAVLCLLSFLYRADILLTPRVYYNNDIYQEFAPYKHYLREAVSKGRFPLWCPQQFSGMPFVPNPQAGVFYPTTLLFLVMPVGRALSLHFFLHNCLAGGFMWGFLRRWKLGQEAAFLGGVLALASGFQAWEVIHPQTLAASVWIVPSLFFLEGSLSRKSLWEAWAAGLCIGMSFLAGNPQMFLGIFYLSVFYALYRMPWKNMRFQNHLFWWTALGTGMGVAAIMAVPFLEMARVGGRSGGMGYVEAASYSFNFKGFLNLLSPFSGVRLGLPPHLVHQHADEWTQGRALGFIGYMGNVALLLSACGLLTKRKKPWLFFLLAALLVLWIGLGRNSGPFNLHKLLYIALPGFRFLRTPFRYLFLYDLSVAILAALGMQSLRDNRVSKTIPSAFLLVMLALVLCDSLGRENPSASFWRFHWVPVCVAFSASVALFLSRKSWSVGLLLLLTPLELFWYKSQTWPIGPDGILEYTDAKPLMTFLESEGGEGRIFLDKNIVLPGSPLDRYAPPVVLDPYLALPANASMVFGLKNASGYNPLMLMNYRDLLSMGYEARRWLRVRFLVTPEKPDIPYPIVCSYGNAHVVDLGPPPPRVWVVRRRRLFPDEETLIQFMLDPLFDPLTDVLFLQRDAPLAPLLGGHGAERDQIKLVGETPETLTLQADLASPAYLVFPDPHCPGWRAALDGRHVPLLQADLAFRALFCPEGSHRVELRYQPMSIKAGLFCSCLCLGVGVLCLVFRSKEKRSCAS